MAASSSPNKQFVARAAAVLTTSEVAAASFILNEAWASTVTVDVDFTVGSLTKATMRFYVSADGTNWHPVAVAGEPVTEDLSADAKRCYAFPSLAGWRFFRASIQGDGTVTGSSATIAYRYLRRGSQ